MYFCPNCNNIFDITKNPKEKQVGGQRNKTNDYAELIGKILEKENLTKEDIESLSVDDLIKDPTYKGLSNEEKVFVYNMASDLVPKNVEEIEEKAGTPTSDKAYFICKNCGYLKPINEQTLIFSRVSSELAQSYVSSDIVELAHSDILPKTRKYICSNSKCVSHTDKEKREACFFRLNNSYKIKYICLACKQVVA
ncbi:MAG: DNA-dependent RNA polymerase subunit Rpb9 [Barrevirus sp.]|uniref:DNA-dependent RNA polymerase subunit Rpb9 n=1 Tax=Barrevirus sp. TaxID=2487763 RepID=A0A3G4ZRI0_9VIRU|nr:MAG: DNA-dependent RNA polymerase subunit Rpb9 [Barrevirus sp.]